MVKFEYPATAICSEACLSCVFLKGAQQPHFTDTKKSWTAMTGRKCMCGVGVADPSRGTDDIGWDDHDWPPDCPPMDGLEIMS